MGHIERMSVFLQAYVMPWYSKEKESTAEDFFNASRWETALKEAHDMANKELLNYTRSASGGKLQTKLTPPLAVVIGNTVRPRRLPCDRSGSQLQRLASGWAPGWSRTPGIWVAKA